jgi:hypothetical protein
MPDKNTLKHKNKLLEKTDAQNTVADPYRIDIYRDDLSPCRYAPVGHLVLLP